MSSEEDMFFDAVEANESPAYPKPSVLPDFAKSVAKDDSPANWKSKPPNLDNLPSPTIENKPKVVIISPDNTESIEYLDADESAVDQPVNKNRSKSLEYLSGTVPILPSNDPGRRKSTHPSMLSKSTTATSIQSINSSNISSRAVSSDNIMVKNLDNGETIAASDLEQKLSLSPIKHSKSSSLSGDSSHSESASMTSNMSKSPEGLRAKGKKLFKDLSDILKIGNVDSKQENTDSIKVKVKHSHNQYFTNLRLAQILNSSNTPTSSTNDTRIRSNTPDPVTAANPNNHSNNSIWIMKFNRNYKYLAAGGKDGLLRLWALKNNTQKEVNEEGMFEVFDRNPQLYSGHLSDILDLSFSKNDFILSASADKTVRLWHVTRKECLCIFQHTDYVTSVSFHPRDDRFFLSGCLDSRLRLWNVQEKRVQHWNEVQGESTGSSSLITSATFSRDGKFAVCGLKNGSCVFYETDGLKYNTQIQIHRKGRLGEKISGIEVSHSGNSADHLLVSSNDSRIRMYNMRDKSMICKYIGHTNESSQIRATFSHDGNFIVSGSEDGNVFIWKIHNEAEDGKERMFGQRRDRNSKFEKFRVSEYGVTCSLILPGATQSEKFIIASDFAGIIRVYYSQQAQ